MKAIEFVDKYGLINAENLLNSSMPTQQKYFRKLKTPCSNVVDAEELMNLVLDSKINHKISRIGIDNLKDYLGVIQVDFNTFSGGIVDACYIERLKQIVDAFELVESYGSLANAKNRCYPAKFVELSNYNALKQAINLVEQCNA